MKRNRTETKFLVTIKSYIPVEISEQICKALEAVLMLGFVPEIISVKEVLKG